MRIVFCGTAGFAAPSLRACAARHRVVAAVTQPDRPGSRGRPASRPVADTARRLGIPVLQPDRIRAAEAIAEVIRFDAEALVVAAYGQILPRTLLEAHPHGGVNVHASLLPRWRGAAPVARAILAGDRVTGVCIMRMEAGLDTGPLYACRQVAIAERTTAPALTEELAVAGAEELVSVLAALERGTARATPQASEGVTLAPRLSREDGLLEWSERSSEEVDRMVRALDPWPGVSAELAGVRLRLLRGCAIAGAVEAPPGTVCTIEGESAVVRAAVGLYRVDQVQPPGRRPMTAAAFLRGRR
ncbi:MAG TPA: methionyl-tRNA formyltransferase [Candidatus Binatia bacterium]|nr:methionyl-tRNA formyltransferase [Candidatus Binatia bacterium]